MKGKAIFKDQTPAVDANTLRIGVRPTITSGNENFLEGNTIAQTAPLAAISTPAFDSCNYTCPSSIIKKNLPVDLPAYRMKTTLLLIEPDPSLSGRGSDEDEECGDVHGGMFIDGYRVGKNQKVERYSETVEDSIGLGDNPSPGEIAGHLNPYTPKRST
ncbi:hypothetical protein RUND412_007834 [Rhizina undulata]